MEKCPWTALKIYALFELMVVIFHDIFRYDKCFVLNIKLSTRGKGSSIDAMTQTA